VVRHAVVLHSSHEPAVSGPHVGGVEGVEVVAVLGGGYDLQLSNGGHGLAEVFSRKGADDVHAGLLGD
jgi:hypothetical protein